MKICQCFATNQTRISQNLDFPEQETKTQHGRNRKKKEIQTQSMIHTITSTHSTNQKGHYKYGQQFKVKNKKTQMAPG